MSIQDQTALATVPESEPINTCARLAIGGVLLQPSQVTSWAVRIFEVTAANPRRPVYKAEYSSTAGVFYNSLQTVEGYLDGGYNFLHTLDEAVFPGGHRGGATYRVEYTINTTNPLASRKILVSTVRISSTYSS